MKHDRSKMIFRFKAQVLFAFFPTSSVPANNKQLRKWRERENWKRAAFELQKTMPEFTSTTPTLQWGGWLGLCNMGLELTWMSIVQLLLHQMQSDKSRQGALILLSDQEKAQILDKFHS